MLTLLLQAAATEFEWRHFLQASAAAAAGALIAALLLGQAYATIDRAVGALIARLAGGAA